MIGRLIRASVWAPGAIPSTELDEQFKRRLFLPVFDVGMIVLGIIVARGMVPPSLLTHWSGYFIATMAAVFIAAGALAFVGVLFPRLEVLELAAKAFLILALFIYPGTLILQGMQGRENTLLAGVGLLLLVGVPMERAVGMYPKVRRHYAQHKRSREQEDTSA